MLAPGHLHVCKRVLVGCVGILLFFSASIAYAVAGQYLILDTSDGGNNFYVGRCFRTNIYAQTDNLDANSVDVVLPYNTTLLAPYTNSGCTVSASSIITDGLFPSYPSNSITSGTIEVTAYDPSGTNPVNTGAEPANGLLGHIFFKVLSSSGSYDLAFDFTLGLTTDTNMAENGGGGTDVLDGVTNLNVALLADTNPPTFTNLSPASGATDVSVTTDLSFRIQDAETGVNSGSIVASNSGTNLSLTVYACTKANSDPVPKCDVTADLGTLAYNSNYTIAATGADLAVTANTGSTSWSFTTEDDTDAPYITDKTPGSGATGIATTSNIVFNIKDYKDQAGVTPGYGVDINTVKVKVKIGTGAATTYAIADAEMTSTGTSEDYQITINPPTDFPENTVVQVTASGSDLHPSSANVMTPVIYTFTTVDSNGPTISDYSPAQSAVGVSATTNVSFRLQDAGAGIDLSNTTVVIEGVTYTNSDAAFSASGTSNNYVITIDPPDFTGGQVVDVSISTQDLASPTPNTASSTYSFTIATGCGTCFVDTETPARFTKEATLSDTISFHVKDTGDGISSSTIKAVLVGSGDALPTSPLTLTGGSSQMTITGTSSDYTVTITLPAAISTNIPYSITIDADNIYGLSMTTVSYTFMKQETETVEVAASCPACPACSCSDGSSGGSGGNGGGRRSSGNRDARRLASIDTTAVATSRRLPDTLSQTLNAAAPEPQTHYTDVEPGSWYEDALNDLLGDGILDSRQMRFRGRDPILRAEVAKMLVLQHGDDVDTPSTPSFEDVQRHEWYYDYVEAAAANGWMKGYNNCYGQTPCYTKPKNRITRAEAAVLLVRYFANEQRHLAPLFNDAVDGSWYENVVQAAADHCILQGDGVANRVHPDRAINRAEFAVMLYRARQNLEYGTDCAWEAVKNAQNPLTGSILASVTGSANMPFSVAMVLSALLAGFSIGRAVEAGTPSWKKRP